MSKKPTPTSRKNASGELAFYADLLGDIKIRIRHAQSRAALAANAEMVRLYWDIGRSIDERQGQEGWGAGVIPRLANDLHNEMPDLKGFSERNLKLMTQFGREYPDLFPIVPRSVAQLPAKRKRTEKGPPPVAQLNTSPNTTETVPSAAVQLPKGPIGQPPVAQLSEVSILQRTVAKLPWAHNILLVQMVKDLPTRIWYMEQTLAQGWSRDTLGAMIKSRVHERQGTAVTNFASTLPAEQSTLAAQILKDPYIFDFLTLEESFHERELETGLVRHLEKFLLELGKGFAFVGRQYRLEVGEQDFYVDLLFYHLHLRCFFVIDLKTGDFQPEYAGKMNFYCSTLDAQLRHPTDQPTIGLILCQTKDRVIAEYSLRDIRKPIGVAEYELTRILPKELASRLPSIEQIEAELQREADGRA